LNRLGHLAISDRLHGNGLQGLRRAGQRLIRNDLDRPGGKRGVRLLIDRLVPGRVLTKLGLRLLLKSETTECYGEHRNAGRLKKPGRQTFLGIVIH
jgi:hypothetical protein